MQLLRKINNSLFPLFFLSSLFFTCPVDASSDLIQEISNSEKQIIVEKLNEHQQNIHSLTATVNQEKQLAVLKKKINVEGAIILKKPNMLRWDTATPEKSMIFADGRTMTVYRPDLKEAQVYVLSENVVAKNTMNFFTTVMLGSLSEMEKKFTVHIFRKLDEIVFKLVPLSKIARKYLSSIMICYDENTGLPIGFEVETPKGDKTVTTLTNINTNPELDPDTFNIKLPSDVRITNKSEQNNY